MYPKLTNLLKKKYNKSTNFKHCAKILYNVPFHTYDVTTVRNACFVTCNGGSLIKELRGQINLTNNMGGPMCCHNQTACVCC